MGISRRVLASVFVLVALVTSCCAQDCTKEAQYGPWLNCRMLARKNVAGAAAQAQLNKTNEPIKKNATNGARQQDSPAVSGNSNSLVDQSSASDLVNLALNLAKLTPTTSNNNNPTSVTVTTSAYALYAAANYHDPLDPDFYSRNRNWRRFFVTLGQDVPKMTASTSTADPHANRYGTVIGFKTLILNSRDISDPKNAGAFSNVLDALSHFSSAQDKVSVDIHTAIPDIDTKFAKLSAQESQTVDQIIDKYVTAFTNMDQVATDAYNQIKNKRQWALSYTADLRDGLGYNQHSIQSVLDWGVTPRLNWTTNFGAEIYDAKKFGPIRNGGSASTDFQYRITENPKQTQPIAFSLSGYGEWLTNVAPTYKVQGKLTIPLGQKTGVSLPISVTYASRTDLIQESHTEAKFGFTFDAAKIAAALLPGVQ
ncbi:MAG TPA: hypothetical protein VFO39_13930 [Candidatus Sulfotelmatobacter sp.]|nr:hypothetical protein [Candidatus Sulfotelmatobacter sp.]